MYILHEDSQIGMAAADARAGDVMGLFRQILRDEDFVARLHYTGIIHIYVLHEKSGADAVVCQRTALLHELHHVIVQQQAGLVFRVGGTVESASSPELAISTMLHFEESVVQNLCLYIGL